MKRVIAIMIMLAAAVIYTIPAKAAEKETICKEDLREICEAAGQEFGICPELLEALAEKESSLQVYAVNGDCCGLCQISKKWHKERMDLLGVSNIFDPEGNIRTAASYLSELFEENDDVYYVLMRYNMKKSTADQLYSDEEYSDYAVSICERAVQLEREHGK